MDLYEDVQQETKQEMWLSMFDYPERVLLDSERAMAMQFLDQSQLLLYMDPYVQTIVSAIQYVRHHLKFKERIFRPKKSFAESYSFQLNIVSRMYRRAHSFLDKVFVVGHMNMEMDFHYPQHTGKHTAQILDVTIASFL